MLSLLGHRLFSFSPKCTRLALSACALALSVPAYAAQEPISITPTVRSVTLQMTRNADQENSQLNLELVARFADGRLLGWSDVQIITIEGPDGVRLTGQGHGTSTLLQYGQTEDDLHIPLTVELTDFIQPPIALKKVCINAIALLGHGATRELVLPESATGRTFAPADNRSATVTVTAEKDHWRLDVSGSLAERCVKILLKNKDGVEVDGNLNQNQASPQRVRFDLRPNNGDIAGTHPVLELVEKIERRPIVLTANHLDLFASNTDPELLPLGGDPNAAKTPVVPAPDSTAVEITEPQGAPKKDF